MPARERCSTATTCTASQTPSTAPGGFVAESVAGLLPYATGEGVDARWLVVESDPAFYEVTKRIHNRRHDDPGDRGQLGEAERATYERALDHGCRRLLAAVAPGDVVVLHDPQAAGLAGPLKAHGAHVVWRCHVGRDRAGRLARTAWDFLRPDASYADICVFTRSQYAWDRLVPESVVVLALCIDVASPKNEPLDDARRDAAGIVPGPGSDLPLRWPCRCRAGTGSRPRSA
jgi:trehalose synthase